MSRHVSTNIITDDDTDDADDEESAVNQTKQIFDVNYKYNGSEWIECCLLYTSPSPRD